MNKSFPLKLYETYELYLIVMTKTELKITWKQANSHTSRWQVGILWYLIRNKILLLLFTGRKRKFNADESDYLISVAKDLVPVTLLKLAHLFVETFYDDIHYEPSLSTVSRELHRRGLVYKMIVYKNDLANPVEQLNFLEDMSFVSSHMFVKTLKISKLSLVGLLLVMKPINFKSKLVDISNQSLLCDILSPS